MALVDPQRQHLDDALSVLEAGFAVVVLYLNVGLEGRCSLDKQSSRACVQPCLMRNGNLEFFHAFPHTCVRSCWLWWFVMCLAQFLHRARCVGGCTDLVQVVPEGGLDGGDDRPRDEWGLAELDPRLDVRWQHLDGDLGAHHRA